MGEISEFLRTQFDKIPRPLWRAASCPKAASSCHRELIRIGASRAARSGGGRELEVRERLLAAEARAMEEPFKAFVLRLIEMSPEGAERLLETARRLYEAEHDA